MRKLLKSSNIKIDLQLFAGEEEDVVDDEEEVVVPDDNLEMDSELDEYEEVVDPQDEEVEEDVQTPEENAQFKKMRLKAEEQARKKLEAERSEIERMKQEMAEQQQEKEIRQNYLSQERIWDKADEEGVSEEVARKLLEHEVKEVIATEKQKVKQKFEELQNQKRMYSKDKYFEIVNEQAERAMRDNPNLNYDTAYLYFRGRVALENDDKYTKEHEKKVEKRTIANIQDGMRRRSTPSSNNSTNADIGILTDEGKEMASAFGVDPRAIAKYVKNNKRR